MAKNNKSVKKRAPRKKKHDKITQKNSTTIGIENTFQQRMPLRPRFSCVLKYSETFQLATGAAGVMGTQQTMRLNCLADPNYSGFGHQPYFYDQLTPLYKQYKVNAVKAVLLWSTPGGSADLMTAYTLYPDLGGLALSGLTVDAVTEQPNVSTGLLSPSGNTRTLEQNMFVPIHKVFGITKKEFSDDEYTSNDVTVNTEPKAQCYLSFAVGSPSGVASEAATCQVTMYFYCEWSARQTQSQS